MNVFMIMYIIYLYSAIMHTDHLLPCLYYATVTVRLVNIITVNCLNESHIKKKKKKKKKKNSRYGLAVVLN